MAEVPRDFLYHLLPSVYRRRDRAIGQPLRALMGTLEHEYQALRRNVQELYDGWFIETCAPWMVPYLGERLGVESATLEPIGARRARLQVAQAIVLRRLKGTRTGLEMASAAHTGWPARVVVPTSSGDEVPDAEVQLWRLRSFPILSGNAHREGDGTYTFHPLGVNSPLFHLPEPPEDVEEPVRAENLPVPLTRRVLERELRAHRENRPPPTDFMSSPGAPRVWDPETGQRIPLRAMAVASLGEGLPEGVPKDPDVRLYIDPVTGRFGFPAKKERREAIRASSTYGLSTELGGGPYFTPSPEGPQEEPRLWQGMLSKHEGQNPWDLPVFPRLLDALRAWIASGHPRAVLWFAGSESWTLHRGGLQLVLPGGYELTLRAMAGERPVLLGNLDLRARGEAALVRLEGLWIGGRVRLRGPLEVQLRHSTLQPGATSGPSLVIEADRRGAQILVEHSIVGAVDHRTGHASLQVVDSVIDGHGREAVQVAHPQARLMARLTRATVFGASRFSVLEDGLDLLFVESVWVAELDLGSLRHSYFPSGSRVPRQEHCLDSQDQEGELNLVFRSRRYGAASYAQLSTRTSREILVGSSTGSELGVFESLRNTERQGALRRAFQDQLPLGITARGIFAT